MRQAISRKKKQLAAWDGSMGAVIGFWKHGHLLVFGSMGAVVGFWQHGNIDGFLAAWEQ